MDTVVLARISAAALTALIAGGMFFLIMAFLLFGGTPKKDRQP